MSSVEPDDVGVRFHEGQIGDQVRERQEIGCLGEKDVVLQKDGHADGADQRREARRLAEGFVGDLLHGEAVGGGIKDGHDGGEDQHRHAGHPVHRQDGGDR